MNKQTDKNKKREIITQMGELFRETNRLTKETGLEKLQKELRCLLSSPSPGVVTSFLEIDEDTLLQHGTDVKFAQGLSRMVSEIKHVALREQRDNKRTAQQLHVVCTIWIQRFEQTQL